MEFERQSIQKSFWRYWKGLKAFWSFKLRLCSGWKCHYLYLFEWCGQRFGYYQSLYYCMTYAFMDQRPQPHPLFPLAHRTKAQEFTFQNSCTAIASWQKISPYIVLNNLHNILDSGIYYYFLNVLWMWCLSCLSKLIRSWEGRSHMKTKKHKLQPFCTHLVWHLLRT